MNYEDKVKYWVPAAEALFDEKYQSALIDLDKALGVTLYQKYSTRPEARDFPLTEPMRGLLVKLAGPHGRTVLKAYRIKAGLDK